MSKTTKCKSRKEAAEGDGILKTEEIPTFMGGEYVQDEKIIQNHSHMMKEIEKAMCDKVSPMAHSSSNTLICRGHF